MGPRRAGRDGRAGADLVVEIGGAGILPHSLNAVAPEGTVAVIGVIAGVGGQTDPLLLIPKAIRMRGIYIGHRAAFEAMNAAVARHALRLVIERAHAFRRARGLPGDARRRTLPQARHRGLNRSAAAHPTREDSPWTPTRPRSSSC